jgi:hypothetical protein
VWQAGSWGAQPKVIVQSVGAKGERVHYLNRQLLPLVRMSVDASIADMSRNTCYPGQTGNQSHLGHLDFLSERHGDGANFCVFIAEKDGESE